MLLVSPLYFAQKAVGHSSDPEEEDSLDFEELLLLGELDEDELDEEEELSPSSESESESESEGDPLDEGGADEDCPELPDCSGVPSSRTIIPCFVSVLRRPSPATVVRASIPSIKALSVSPFGQ